MLSVKISKELKQLCPGIRLGIIQSVIEYQKENNLLWQEIEEITRHIRNTFDLNQIANLPVIHHTRQAYLSIGKEPARYRCSAESLLRRIVKGKELYQISNVVDIINFISLFYYFSIGCYDVKQLIEPIIFDIGQKGDIYHAIGRGILNIENLPVFRDKISPFGSPTSDSMRSMITEKTREIIIMIIDFYGKDSLDESLDKTCLCLKKFAGAKEIINAIIS